MPPKLGSKAGYESSSDPICTIYCTTIIPRALVRKVMLDFYHQQ